jgi:hypothetical protein
LNSPSASLCGSAYSHHTTAKRSVFETPGTANSAPAPTKSLFLLGFSRSSGCGAAAPVP